MPLKSISNASARSRSFAAPSGTLGHAKVPCSRRLVISHNPLPSQ